MSDAQGEEGSQLKDKLDITFLADSIKIYGPKVDGSFTVTFATGEYEQLNIAKLMAISQATIIKVKVGVDED